MSKRPFTQDLTLWHQALTLCGLQDLPQSWAQLTLLAPSNTALQTWMLEQGMSWSAARSDPSALRRMLLSHVLPCLWDSAKGHTPQRFCSWGSLELEVVLSHPASTQGGAGSATITDQNGTRAIARPAPSALDTPLPVYVLDRVLQPPRTGLMQRLWELKRCSGFAQALRLSGWGQVLSTNGCFTIFAPVDDAFTRWRTLADCGTDAGLAASETMRHRLGQHIVPGLWQASSLPWGGQLLTAVGTELPVSPLGLLGHGDSAQALGPQRDLLARNGVIHVVNELLPT